MAKLIYMSFTSLDGYTKDDEPDYDWGVPVDKELQTYVNQLTSSLGAYLYGEKTYERDVFWETGPPTIHESPKGPVYIPLPQYVLDCMRQWQSAEKIVYSRTLTEARTALTRIEREFNLDAVRRLKADVKHDIGVHDPELAAQSTRAGLVDEFQMIVNPVIIGGGTQPFPNDVRVDLHLVEERRFGSGVVVLRYTPRDRSTESLG
jgi:dihydrofolate reductase